MARRSAHDVAIELGHMVARAREAFLDSATHWVQLRHRFLVRTGKQPAPGETEKTRKRRQRKSRR